MRETPKVSVILTSFNHEKYLSESIESVLNQTYSDFELFIWDDGSTDSSWEIIKSYSDPQIRAFRNETEQRGSPIQSVYPKVSTQGYIAIQHSDDIWETTKLEKQVTFLDSHPEIGAVFSQAKIIDENSRLFQDQDHFYYKIFDQPNRSRFEWLNFFFYQGNALCHPSVLIRKQCYDDCGLYRYGLAQAGDFDMWVRLCLKYDIHVLPEKLVSFRVRASESNASGNRPEVRSRGQFEFLKVLENYKEIQTFEELEKVFPIAKKYARSENVDLGFVLGMVALEIKSYKFTELFGLNLLFEALNDTERADQISKQYGFTQSDFIELTGKHDVFSILWMEELNLQIEERTLQIKELTDRLSETDAQLRKIYNSGAWKIWLFVRRIRSLFITPTK